MYKKQSFRNVMNLFTMVKSTLKHFGFIKSSLGLNEREKKDSFFYHKVLIKV